MRFPFKSNLKLEVKCLMTDLKLIYEEDFDGL